MDAGYRGTYTMERIWKKSYLAKSLWGWCGCSVQKLFTKILKMLRMTTNMMALNLALKPTTTMTQATKPSKLTQILQKLQSPRKTKPTKRKMSRTRPASWKYILRSFSSNCGRPAGANFLRTQESDRTIKRPPMTDKLRRKKLRSKTRPYPIPWRTTTPMSPITPWSEFLRAMIIIEQTVMAITLMIRKRCVRPLGTVARAHVSCVPGTQSFGKVRTVSVVVQIRELVAPLCYYAERILEKGNNNQKTSNCRKVPVQDISFGPSPSFHTRQKNVHSFSTIGTALTASPALIKYRENPQSCSFVPAAARADWGRSSFRHCVQRCRKGSGSLGGSRRCHVSAP